MKFDLTRLFYWRKKKEKVWEKQIAMEVYVKRLLGDKFKLEELKKKKIGVEIFDNTSYKIWTSVDEFERDDIFKRLCQKGGNVVKLNLYVDKPSYLSVNSNYVDAFSFDERSLSSVTDIIRKVFDFKELYLPGLGKLPKDSKVEYVHFFDDSSHIESSLVFDGPRTQKEVIEKLKDKNLISFIIQLDYKKNGIYINGAKFSKDTFHLYLISEEDIDKKNEIKVVKTLSEIIDELSQTYLQP